MCTRVNDPLHQFVSEVSDLYLERVGQGELAEAVAFHLRMLLRTSDWLEATYRVPWAERYRQHVLYVAPGGTFSVVALVWRPGQRTPIHDHIAWCVAGVLAGNERETRYHLYQEASEQFLVETGTHTLNVGDVGVLVPPDEDIHCVECAGTDTAISIHVYGADISVLGSSINHRFDDLPIRPIAPAATPIAWR